MEHPQNDSQRIGLHEMVLFATCQFLKGMALELNEKDCEQVNEILADARELMPQYSEQLRSI